MNPKPQPGLWIFTDKHFSYLFVTTDKPRPEIPAAKMTEKDRSDAYNGFIASGGTYDIKGDNLTMNVMVARNAESMRSGAFFTNTYKLDGNNLSVTRTGNQNGHATNVQGLYGSSKS
jgi:hypothetical protein